MSILTGKQCLNYLRICEKCSVQIRSFAGNCVPVLFASYPSPYIFKIQTRRRPDNAKRRCLSHPCETNRRCYGSRPVVTNTMDEEELKKFTALANTWWDETGEFEALHTMNRLRVPFIRDCLVQQLDLVSEDPSLPLQGLSIVDAGSGGGLLSEPLSRLGAQVIGVDPVEESIKVAQLHLEDDPDCLPRVKYITGSVEDLVVTEAECFDAVVASEVVEHVADLVTFLDSCCKLLKPGGSLFVTTINKTQMSRGLAVFAAEKVLRIVPEGTHDWDKFVPPRDLTFLLEKYGVHTRKLHGMLYNPVCRQWTWVSDININYALHAVKTDTQEQ